MRKNKLKKPYIWIEIIKRMSMTNDVGDEEADTGKAKRVEENDVNL